jgi:hypothetical protein
MIRVHKHEGGKRFQNGVGEEGKRELLIDQLESNRLIKIIEALSETCPFKEILYRKQRETEEM